VGGVATTAWRVRQLGVVFVGVAPVSAAPQPLSADGAFALHFAWPRTSDVALCREHETCFGNAEVSRCCGAGRCNRRGSSERRAAAIGALGDMTQVWFVETTNTSKADFVTQVFDHDGRALGVAQVVESKSFNAATELGAQLTTAQIILENSQDPNYTTLVNHNNINNNQNNQ